MKTFFYILLIFEVAGGVAGFCGWIKGMARRKLVNKAKK